MLKKKNRIIWTLVAILIAAISIYFVIAQSKNFSIESFVNFITGSNPMWWILALLCMLAFIIFEGLAIKVIIKAFGYPKSASKCLLYSASDIYFSAITPSATGGQPVCGLFMARDGIPGGIVTVSLILNLVMYTVSIMITGIAALIFKPEIFNEFDGTSKTLIIIGYVMMTGLNLFFIVLLKSSKIVHKLSRGLLKFLRKIRIIKDISKLESKLQKSMDDYEECARMIRGQKTMLLKVFIYNFLQRTLQICITAIVFLATGGAVSKAFDVWMTQVYVVMGSNCLPVPGAMGVSDYLLMDGMKNFMDEASVTDLDLLSRGVSFYICIILTGIIVAIGFFTHRGQKSEQEIEAEKSDVREEKC